MKKQKPLTQEEIKEYNQFLVSSMTMETKQKLMEQSRKMTIEDIANITFDDYTPSAKEVRLKLKEFRRLKKAKEVASKRIRLDDIKFD